MEALRAIALDCGLTEALKWGKPCYASEGKNIVVIQGFKSYCALLFFKGFLLNDPDGILVKMGANTRVGRQVRVASVKEVSRLAPSLRSYIYEAIEVEKAGLKESPHKQAPPCLPEELQKVLDKKPAFKAAFEALTPGRQRAYIFYFSQPKHSKTRTTRIEKYTPLILKGKGLHDR